MTISPKSNGVNGHANGDRPDQWFNHPFSMLQTNLREIDVTMDVEEVAQFIKDYGADAWLIGVGGIQAQYPSKLPFQAVNPALRERPSGDLIGDAFKAAKTRGLKLLARMDFSKVSPGVATQHPDWCYRSAKGQLQTHTADLVSVCPNGAWYQERLFDIIEEVTTLYQLDGFFFNWISFNEIDYNMFVHGPCHCDNCRTGFRTATGLDLPVNSKDANYPRWVGWSNAILDDIGGRVRAFIAERAPQAGLIMGQTADIMFHEANNYLGLGPSWHHATSEWAGLWRSFKPEIPVLVNCTTFFDMPYRMASENAAMFEQYLVQAISRGGNPSTYMMGVPGKIPYRVFEAGAAINQFHGKWKVIYDGLRPVVKTALVRPEKSQMPADRYAGALHEYRGLYTALTEKHVLFDIVSQERIEAMGQTGGLGRYKTLILPNLGLIDAASAKCLDAWVEAGGQLVATGSIGVEDDGSVQLRSLPATRLERSITERTAMFSSYIAPIRKANDVHRYDGPVIPLWGAYHFYDYRRDTRSVYKRLDNAAFAPPEYAYGNLQHDHPGAAVSTHGLGKGIVIPFTVGIGYHEVGNTMFRDFLLLVLRQEAPVSEPLSLDIAEQVEATLHRNGNQAILHLVNMSGAKKSNFVAHLPVSGGSIKVSGQGVRARSLQADKDLQVKDGVIQLDTLGLFDVILLEGLY